MTPSTLSYTAAGLFLLGTALILTPGFAQRGKTLSATSPAHAFDPSALPDQELGRRFSIKPEDLPPLNTAPIVSARSLTIPYQGQQPRASEGFTVTAFATGLAHPRRLLVLPNGDVIVAEQKVGYLTLLRDDDGDGKADFIERHAEGFNAPYGARLARWPCPGCGSGWNLESAASPWRFAAWPRRGRNESCGRAD